MLSPTHLHSLLLITAACGILRSSAAWGCAAISRATDLVVNADQSVILLWSPETKQQHFIRKATFDTDAEDIGFIVPTPTQPELEESGNEAFDTLRYITAPLVPSGGLTVPFSCSAAPMERAEVTILERKEVAGFDAVVLTAGSSGALTSWLKENDYHHSPAIKEWAAPYIEKDWAFTALKVAADPEETTSNIATSALRISFQTERPLFPYREPTSGASAEKLGTKDRLLRIYFISDHAYEAYFETNSIWQATRAWAGPLLPYTEQLLNELNIPAEGIPEDLWLTEFEHQWPFDSAPGDLYFKRSAKNEPGERNSNFVYSASGPALLAWFLWAWVRRKRG